MKTTLTANQAQHLLDLINDELRGTTRQKQDAEKSENIPLYKSLRAHEDALYSLRANYLESLKKLTFTKKVSN